MVFKPFDKGVRMTVKELIKKLKKCDQKQLIFVYYGDDIHEIHSVDDSVSDRVDINILE